MSLRTYFAVLVCGALLAGCGDDAPDDVRTSAATATPSTTASPAPTVAGTPATTVTPTPTPTATPPQDDEGGDEDGNRPEVQFDLHVEDVQPARIEVPAFLGLKVRIRNRSGSERILRLDDEPLLELLPGSAETVTVEGLQPGEHVLEAGESGRAVLVAVRAG